MKKMMTLILTLLMCFSLAACGEDTEQPSADADAAQEEPVQEEPAEPTDLTGEWKQTNGDETSYQAGTIADGVIEIYWVNEEDDSKALYWAGTYVAPTDVAEPYTWDSENDTEKTGSSIMASPDDTKTFTYEDGVLSYEASALGVTQTVKMEKQK